MHLAGASFIGFWNRNVIADNGHNWHSLFLVFYLAVPGRRKQMYDAFVAMQVGM